MSSFVFQLIRTKAARKLTEEALQRTRLCLEVSRVHLVKTAEQGALQGHPEEKGLPSKKA